VLRNNSRLTLRSAAGPAARKVLVAKGKAAKQTRSLSEK
jgi:hypothetical protein